MTSRRPPSCSASRAPRATRSAPTALPAVVAAGATSPEEGLAATAGNQTVAELIGHEAAILGEKVELRRVAVISAAKYSVYLHKTNKDLPPQVGVVVGYTGDDADTARGIAQHISFADPLYLSREDVPTDEVERERAIVTEIAKGEGKPEAALPKIIEGRLNGFFKQLCSIRTTQKTTSSPSRVS